MIARESRARAPRCKLLIKDTPCFIGVNKGERKLRPRSTRSSRRPKASASSTSCRRSGWAPCRRASERVARADTRHALSSSHFGDLLADWHVLLQGADLHARADGGVDRSPASRSASPAPRRAASARHGCGGLVGRLCRADPQHAVHRAAVLHLLRPAGAGRASCRRDRRRILAMVINLGAYSTEIIRAGIEAMPNGQIEAGVSLAMTKWEVLRHVVLPPALQKVWPALSARSSSSCSARRCAAQISAQDLTYAANLIQSRNFRTFEVYLVGSAGLSAAGHAARVAAARPRPHPVQGEAEPWCSSPSGTSCRTCCSPRAGRSCCR